MANGNAKTGEAKSQKELEEMAFANLKNKVAASLKIEPDASYLILVKKGSLNKMERDVFLSLWERNLKTGMLIFEVDDPQKDVVALEVAKK